MIEHADTPDESPRVPLFPDLFVSGLTGIVLMLCLYSVLCILVPAALDIRANTAVPPTDAKPAWYLLFLLSYVREVPRWVGAITPVLLVLILVAWPFLDRNPAREPRKRVVALVFGAFVAVALVVLTYVGWVA